jgi:hypothetical protein
MELRVFDRFWAGFTPGAIAAIPWNRRQKKNDN